jgi:hypothetical protein
MLVTTCKIMQSYCRKTTSLGVEFLGSRCMCLWLIVDMGGTQFTVDVTLMCVSEQEGHRTLAGCYSSGPQHL